MKKSLEISMKNPWNSHGILRDLPHLYQTYTIALSSENL